MNLDKLIELNKRGLITDEALAAAVNEHYGKADDKDRRQELIEKNKKHTEELRRKVELIKENKELSKEYDEAIKFLSTLRDSRGKKVYSADDLKNMSSFEAVSLASEIKPVRRKENLNLFRKYYVFEGDESMITDKELEEAGLRCKLYDLNNTLSEDKKLSQKQIGTMPIEEVEATLDKLNGVEKANTDSNELTEEQKQAIQNLPGAPVSNLNPEKPKKVSKIASAAQKLKEAISNNKLAAIASCAALIASVALVIANPALAGTLAVGGIGTKAATDIYKGFKGR